MRIYPHKQHLTETKTTQKMPECESERSRAPAGGAGHADTHVSCPPVQPSAGPERGRGDGPESWTLLPGAGLPDVGRVCPATAAQPGRAETEGGPADAPGGGGVPGGAPGGAVPPGRLRQLAVLRWSCVLNQTRTLVCLRFSLWTPARPTPELRSKANVRRGAPARGAIPGPCTHTSGRDQPQTRTLQPST